MIRMIWVALDTLCIPVAVICLVTYCSGYNEGRVEAYGHEITIAANSYEAELGDLQNQIKDISANYDKEIVSLQKKQTLEINVLQKKKALEITALQSDQNSEISNLQEKQYLEADRLEAKHEKEVIETRDSYYIKGQTDARTSVQKQIDSKAAKNMSKNDWDAPVYSVKK